MRSYFWRVLMIETLSFELSTTFQQLLLYWSALHLLSNSGIFPITSSSSTQMIISNMWRIAIEKVKKILLHIDRRFEVCIQQPQNKVIFSRENREKMILLVTNAPYLLLGIRCSSCCRLASSIRHQLAFIQSKKQMFLWLSLSSVFPLVTKSNKIV